MNCTYSLITTRSIPESAEVMGTVVVSNNVSHKIDHTITMLAENEVPTPIQEFVLPMTPNSSPISPQNYIQFESQVFSKSQLQDKSYNDTFSGIIIEEYLNESIGNMNPSIGDSGDGSNNDNAISIEEQCPVNTSISHPVTDGHCSHIKDYETLIRTITEDSVNEADLVEPDDTSFLVSSEKLIDIVGPQDPDETEEIEKENENDFDNDMDDFEDEEDGDNSSEQDLTNLGWLIDLKNLTTWSDNSGTNSRNGSGAAVNGCPLMRNINIIDDIDDDDGCLGPIISDRDISEERFNKFMIQVKQSQLNYAERKHIYKVEPLEKPPFNYAQIIAMAMMENGRMTLKDICKWIQERFAYFRYNKNWNNSIRHNLSLHFCFTKIARDKAEKGKGGYWELSMNSAKSEKKRIRNRKKHRDESGRFSNNHHNNFKSNKTSSSNGVGKQTIDSPPVSSASDVSSSISSVLINNDDAMKEIEAIPDNEIVILDHQPNEQSVNELDNNLVLIDSTASIKSNSSLNIDYNNSNYYIAETLEPNINNDEIFLGNDIPLCDNSITVHYSTSTYSKHGIQIKMGASDAEDPGDTVTDIILCNDYNSGPNVIVEPLPYGLSHMDTVLDIEREFSSLVNMPDPELIEEAFFDYANW